MKLAAIHHVAIIVSDYEKARDFYVNNRNLLGHADIEKVVSEEKIRQLSRSIMDVLWFSLWNKAK